MKHVKKSVLLWYSPRDMYELVTDVEQYPKFLPWCERAEVLQEDDSGMTARLHLGYAGVHHAFTTRNEHIDAQSVVVKLVDGPFSLLDGTWNFVPLGTGGHACRIEFDLCYAFKSGPLELVLTPVFDRVANSFVDAFVKRAEVVYGPR